MKGDVRCTVSFTAEQAEFVFGLLLNHRGGEPGFRRGIEGILEALEKHGDPVPEEIRTRMAQANYHIPAGMFRFIAVGTKADDVITPEDMKERLKRTFSIEVKAWWLSIVAFAVMRTASANASMADLKKFYLPTAKALLIETQFRKAVGLDGGDEHDGEEVALDTPKEVPAGT